MLPVIMKIAAVLSICCIGVVGFVTTKKCNNPRHHHHHGTTTDLGTVDLNKK